MSPGLGPPCLTEQTVSSGNPPTPRPVVEPSTGRPAPGAVSTDGALGAGWALTGACRPAPAWEQTPGWGKSVTGPSSPPGFCRLLWVFNIQPSAVPPEASTV